LLHAQQFQIFLQSLMMDNAKPYSLIITISFFIFLSH